MLILLIIPSYLIFSKEKSVLLVNSYHKGFLWSDNIVKGVEDVINKDGNIDLHIEYLDSKRQFDDKYNQLIYNLIEYKFNNRKYDVIITTDNNAFNFINNYKESLFKETPIVFSGLNYISEEDLQLYKNTTGINERANLKANIDLIHRLQPEVRKIVIITDDTVSGKQVQKEAEGVINSNGRNEIELLFDTSMEELV